MDSFLKPNSLSIFFICEPIFIDISWFNSIKDFFEVFDVFCLFILFLSLSSRLYDLKPTAFILVFVQRAIDISIESRLDIEQYLNKKVHLYLYIKLRKNNYISNIS